MNIENHSAAVYEEISLPNGEKINRASYDAKQFALGVLKDKHADVYAELFHKCHDQKFKISEHAQTKLQKMDFMKDDKIEAKVRGIILSDAGNGTWFDYAKNKP